MITAKRTVALLLLAASALLSNGQLKLNGKVIDSVTKAPVYGATVICTDAGCYSGTTTNIHGYFEMSSKDCHELTISFIGYATRRISINKLAQLIALLPSTSLMNAVVVSSGRGDAIRRSEVPVAISQLGARTLQDAKAISADQLLNKISGVNMVNLGNEQHQMSIRQPMTTKSLFLYLEDGIPIRTTGLFNHNALLEMNMTAVKSIEVMKGPSSSLYGSEAIGGVVNFLTSAPPVGATARLSVQGNNMGYKRTDLQAGFTKKKWGFLLSGYIAEKKNGFLDFTDFHKGIFSARVDHRFNERTVISSTTTWLHYYSDMPGGIDSAMFQSGTFTNPQTFTYRKVDAIRYRSTLTQQWNENSKTTASVVYRNNRTGQNPAYRIKDDYKKSGNSWTGKKDLAHGEINESRFESYVVVAQHRQKLNWNNANIMAGTSIDLSPSRYGAEYIRVKKDSVTQKYTGYQGKDSTLTSYSTGIHNYAAFINVEVNALQQLRLVASLRYDFFNYRFNNHLRSSSFSGSPDTVNQFGRVSPKIGLTYKISGRSGAYGNVSQGFVPPQITEMYTGVKVPSIRPAIFQNYEIGGWTEFARDRIYAEASMYYLAGTNEIIPVRLDDGSMENRNAGNTSHSGIELMVNASPAKGLTMRFSGAYSVHRFRDFVEKGNDYSRNQMNGAPNWIHNIEVWYKPSFLKGWRTGMEWQKVGSYFMDAKNTTKYKGYNVWNFRTAYALKHFELWLNVMNCTDRYYSYLSTKGTTHRYTIAEPRTFQAGISIDLVKLFHN